MNLPRNDPAQTTDKHRFLVLDAMRGIAALAVMVLHVGGRPGSLLPGAYLAVDFFFLLSGFILALAYGGRAYGLLTFMRMRLARLYPLYIAGTAIGLIACLAARAPGDVLAVLLAIAFLPSPPHVIEVGTGLAGFLYPYDRAAWSLFYELVINAVWVALLFRASRPVYAAVIAIAGLLVCIIVQHNGSISVGTDWATIIPGFGRVAFSFLAGVAIYRLVKLPSQRSTAAGWAAPALLVVMFMLGGPRHLVDAAALLFVFPALLLLGAAGTPPAWARPLCAELGRLSYPFYALHIPVFNLLQILATKYQAFAFLGPAVTRHAWLLIAPLTFVLVYCLSHLLLRFESAVRAWARRTAPPLTPNGSGLR